MPSAGGHNMMEAGPKPQSTAATMLLEALQRTAKLLQSKLLRDALLLAEAKQTLVEQCDCLV